MPGLITMSDIWFNARGVAAHAALGADVPQPWPREYASARAINLAPLTRLTATARGADKRPMVIVDWLLLIYD
jgi:hypothetical protein